MRSVFSSESVKVVQFGTGGPPGPPHGGAEGWRAVTRVLRSCAAHLRDDLVTTVFPDDCNLCGLSMTGWTSSPVCSACIARVFPQHGQLCSICGEALGLESARFAGALGSSVCTMCRLAPPDFEQAVAYAGYADELREMLHLLKYQGVTRLASAQLGEWMAICIAQLAEQASEELTVVAVPLFAARQRERSFNQSVLLADAAIARLRKSHPAWKLTPAHGALVRSRDTDAQYGLNPAQRKKNLQGAFKVVDVDSVCGREVLLVDDVMTTGATARECARVLVRAGATKVWVATLARVQAEAGAGDVAMWSVVEPDPRKRTGFDAVS